MRRRWRLRLKLQLRGRSRRNLLFLHLALAVLHKEAMVETAQNHTLYFLFMGEDGEEAPENSLPLSVVRTPNSPIPGACLMVRSMR